MTQAQDIIRINQAAQGLHTLEDTSAWFSEHNAQEQRQLIQAVGYMALQAGAVPADAQAAAERVGVKPGIPACVLMSKGVPKQQLAKVLELPEEENLRSFSFLVGLLSVADVRRKSTKCATGCSHWWHRNLGDEEVVEQILSSGEAGS